MRLAAIGLGDLRHARGFREEAKIEFPLLVDEKRVAYRAAALKSAGLLDLFRPRNFAARSRAKAAGHRQTGLGRNPFQLGGCFAFGPGDIDRFSAVGTTFGEVVPAATLLGALASSEALRRSGLSADPPKL